ncbi:MAG: flagellar assembly protein FliH [Myxococcaceae bacterium]|jgi:type III secretion protein L|nr:flagellar assembly protein FliH [Myxococcaceae bacterium]MCA3013028.1 flagellar assembly protein FliH [Myxococcaceae bacterium]
MEDERRSGPASRVLGKVIKSGEGGDPHGSDKPILPPPRRGGVVNAEEFEAMTTAKQIVADAQKKAEEIKAEALRFKEEVFAKAREEAKADVQARAAEELARAKMQAGQIVAAAERDVLELALKMSAKIIGRDLERDPEVVLEICATAVEAARGSKAMVLKVHPDDGKVLREKRPRLMDLIGRAVDLAIRDDAEVERGGCVIQTEYGTIDGQIRTQFEMLRNVLMPDSAKKENK